MSILERNSLGQSISVPISNRFWLMVSKTDTCWLWTGRKRRGGYGVLSTGGWKTKRRLFSAHRLSWEITYGPIPPSLLICHHCDTPSCVRPSHLFLGCSLDNNKDMAVKGRAAQGSTHGSVTHPLSIPRGERNGMAKLTAADVVKLRALYCTGRLSQRQLGVLFSISQPSVWRIVTNKTWMHVI